MTITVCPPSALKTTLLERISEKNNTINCLGRIFSYVLPSEYIKDVRCVSKLWQKISKYPEVIERQLKNCKVVAENHLCRTFLSAWLSNPRCYELPLLLTHFFLLSRFARFENRFHFHLGEQWHRVFIKTGVSTSTLGCDRFDHYGERMVNILLSSQEENAKLMNWHLDPYLIPFIKKVTVNAAHVYAAELEDANIPYVQLCQMLKILLKDAPSSQLTMPFFNETEFAFLLSIMPSNQDTSLSE